MKDSAIAAARTDERHGLVASAVAALIRGYQKYISPLSGPHCRFYPSCSQYALTAVRRFGVAKGSWLALRRIARCHPWNPGGVDHVPSVDERRGRTE